MADQLQARMGEIDECERPQFPVVQEASMAGDEKDVYLAFITARDPQVRALLEQGFTLVTDAINVGTAPPRL